jgi:hypothetical protein
MILFLAEGSFFGEEALCEKNYQFTIKVESKTAVIKCLPL